MAEPKQQKYRKRIKLLRQQVHYLEELLDNSPDIIVAGDTQGNITQFNKSAEKLLGYKKKEVLGKSIEMLYFYPYDRKKLMELLKKKNAVVDYEIRLKDKYGRLFDFSTSLGYLRDPKGKIIGTIGIAKDIRRRKLLQKQLAQMAITDGLTKLYTRGYFNIRINQTVARVVKQGSSLSLIMIDLDGLKEYNDHLGHLAGDNILQEVGSIIKKSSRSHNISAYRYGGDEFVILISHKYKNNTAQKIAEKIRGAVQKQFKSRITASIGVTRLKPKQGVHKFIKSADEAMYKAKKSGKNCICVT